jgi:uncharacterized protein (DUF58 family)
MAREATRLLDPASVARLGTLEVAARFLVEGFIKGLHFSARKGSSIEFAEHRAYVPGDEVRRIDWRTFGKTDRFYLKEYEDETNLRATLVVDASASMGFGTAGISKLRYAELLAAALGYLLLGQRDAVGLALVDGSVRRYVPPRATPEHLAGVFRALDGASAAGTTRLADCLHRLAGRLRRRSFVCVISDFLDDPRAVLKSLANLRHRGAEVILFHILDPAEEEFPFTNWTVFEDSEDRSSRIRIDARQVRETYLENLAEHVRILRTGSLALGVDCARLSTKTPFEEALAAYLEARARRRR